MKDLLFSVFCWFEFLLKYFLFSFSWHIDFSILHVNTLVLYLPLNLYVNIHFNIHFEILRFLTYCSGELGKLLGKNQSVNN